MTELFLRHVPWRDWLRLRFLGIPLGNRKFIGTECLDDKHVRNSNPTSAIPVPVMYSGLNTNCCSGKEPSLFGNPNPRGDQAQSVIRDLSICLDNSALWCIKGTGESMTRVHGFIGSFYVPWSRQILDHWSWSKSPQRNGLMDIRSRWINLQ